MSRSRKIEWIMFATLVPTLASMGILMSIFVFLAIDSLPIIISEGIEFLTGSQWYPDDSDFGIFPMIFGSLIVTLLATLFSVPLAVGSAVFVSEFLSDVSRVWMKGCMELLAGIPSIVYGLIGIAVLNEVVKSTFSLNDGSCILTASILLAVMILPTIMTLSEDAIHNVPNEYRETALSLGMTKMETIVHSVIPMAIHGILSSMLLGVGRALGETMAVMLVIGSIDRLPSPFYNILSASQTITSKLGREAAESLGSGLHWNALVGMGFVLLLIVTGITFVSRNISNRWER